MQAKAKSSGLRANMSPMTPLGSESTMLITEPIAPRIEIADCVDDVQCQPKKSKCGAKTSSYLRPGSGQP